MTLTAPRAVEGGAAPTVICLPDFHYPKDNCVVEVTSGKWEIGSDEDEGGVVLQRLRWWHADGQQSIRITGEARRYNSEADEDNVGYYAALSQGVEWLGNCTVM